MSKRARYGDEDICTTKGATRLMAAARNHGRQSRDLQQRDLEQIIRACWKRLTPPGRSLVLEEFSEFIAEWERR